MPHSQNIALLQPRSLLDRPKGRTTGCFWAVGVGELMFYLDEHALRIRQDRGFENSGVRSYALSEWALVCNQDGMQTGEIILLVGVIGTMAGATAAVYRRTRRIPEPAGAEPEPGAPDHVDVSGSAALDINELLRRTLRRDLSLAAEHVHSIHSLLEIARQHQQPIPNAALTNLGLVSKHLVEIERRIEDASGAVDSPLSASANRRENQPPLRLRPPSFGCHVSPCDRSTPFD